MEGDGEADLGRLAGQLPDLRGEAAGGDGDVARADVEAPGGIDDADGAEEVGQVGQRLAHAHEDDVVDPLAALFFDGEKLVDDFGRVEVAGEAVEAARAEFAAVSAADLGGDAGGAAVGGFAVKRGRRGDEDGLDQVAVGEAEEELASGVLRAEDADDFRPDEGEILRQRGAGGGGEVGHGVEAGDALLVEPVGDLFRAVGGRVFPGEIFLYLLKGAGFD